jgi:hypothetical protein
MLMHFDADTTPRQTSREVSTAPTVVETVTVTTLPSEARGFLSRDDAQWSWSDLRDYVVHEIERRFGTFPRDAKKEFGIFSRFVKEHGEQAAAIAKYAFEVCDGWWQGAPISVNRFCKGSDFAAPIKQSLVAQPVQDW